VYSSRTNSQRKPLWLKAKIPSGQTFFQVLRLLKDKKLNTICQSAKCPNISECWAKRTATFLILGNVCTRSCAFCSVNNGIPLPVSKAEAEHISEVISDMGLRYAVITSVTRDDLPDGGASYFAAVIKAIKKTNPRMKVEVLIPDFKGNISSLKSVLAAEPDVLNHNLEVPEKLYPKITRPIGNYKRSLSLLKNAHAAGFITKSGLMIGLGEDEKDIFHLFSDLQDSGCKFLTVGQYLRSLKSNVPVSKYYSLDEFSRLKSIAYDFGFERVEAGPLVRSSYKAQEMFDSYTRTFSH